MAVRWHPALFYRISMSFPQLYSDNSCGRSWGLWVPTSLNTNTQKTPHILSQNPILRGNQCPCMVFMSNCLRMAILGLYVDFLVLEHLGWYRDSIFGRASCGLSCGEPRAKWLRYHLDARPLPKGGRILVKTEKTKNDLLHSLSPMNKGHGEHGEDGEEVSSRSFEMSQRNCGLSLQGGWNFSMPMDLNVSQPHPYEWKWTPKAFMVLVSSWWVPKRKGVAALRL